MRKWSAVLMLAILLAGGLGLSLRSSSATATPYFRPHDESPSGYFALFRDLCDSYPNHADYVSIGKSYLGKTIWMFRIGNPNGGRICWTAAMHGWEDMGTEVMYLYAKWLLETNSDETNRILNNNYALLIPIVNVDRLTRNNADYSSCSTGVNLLRNFPIKWSHVSCADNDYHGPYALSEPEAIAVHRVLQTYRPIFYLDAHYGGGGVTGTGICYSTTAQPGGSYVGKPAANEFIAKYRELADTLNVPTYWFSINAPASGFASTDADALGSTAFLLEVAGEEASPGGLCYSHEAPGQSLEDIRTYWFPKCLPIFLAMNSLSASRARIVDIYDAIKLAGAFGSKPPNPNFDPNADINGDGIVDIYDALLLAAHYGQHYP
jgi:hypothetical protein